MGRDTTSRETRTNCLDRLEVFLGEVEILRPRSVILYSGRDYDDHIERYTSKFEHRDERGRSFSRENGKKTMLWWDRRCTDQAGRQFRVLRTSHPERQKKQPFVEKLVSWVREAV